MSKVKHYTGVLSLNESERFHEELQFIDYDSLIGHNRKRIHFDQIVQPGYEKEKSALGKLAKLLSERLDWYPGFNPEKWKAAINVWSATNIVHRPYFMKAHRDRIGANVAVVSLHGEGKFISGLTSRGSFDVLPGDVVVMNNECLIPPKHAVRIDTDTRLSVVMWNAEHEN